MWGTWSLLGCLALNHLGRPLAYEGQLFGVRAIVTSRSYRVGAMVTVHVRGLGVDQRGTATIEDTEIVFDNGLRHFLRQRKVRILGAKLINGQIRVSAELPLLGTRTVTLTKT